ncbi:MAG: tRNA glutamyl-Q(34) synthetase GluQRS [Eggerthellaceae bacterium]|nr:tRNA glutamyl-Q(34) synthetase GluQRS [Eggerthellaceae bacterium]
MANASAAQPPRGRFAPSPTGRLHAGNIFSYLVAYIVAHRAGGTIALRIEDLDPQRSKSVFAQACLRDLDYLGLGWDVGPLYQSERTEIYREAFHELESKGLVYPCFCTRADVHAASAPHRGEKFVYAGTCRNLTAEQREERARDIAAEGRAPSMRLIVPDRTYAINDLFQGRYEQNLACDCGDFLIRRSDGAFAYQLAVVVDDAAQQVTQVVRGVDLLSSSPQQAYVQDLLGFGRVSYGHVPLLVSRTDRRLSKRDHDASIDQMRVSYGSAAGILGHIAYVVGMVPDDAPATVDELVVGADLAPLAGCIQKVWKA